MPLPAVATDDHPGAWIAFSMSDAFQSGGEDSRWHYWLDSQARFFDPGSGATQFVIRPGIGYRLTDKLQGWLGYARIRSESSAAAVSHENRYWQQLDWSAGRLIGGDVTMRARLEQRSASTGDDVGVVLRFRAKYVRPLGTGERSSLIIGIEPFVDLRDTDWKGRSGLTQNRVFIGIGWRVGKRTSIESGYMNQYIWIDGAENRSFHHGVLNFNVRM
jgi:hypothetical protein